MLPETDNGRPAHRTIFYPWSVGYANRLSVKLVVLKGRWEPLRFIEGKLESAQSFETDSERIVRILVQRNPDKLVRIAAAHLNG